MPIPCPPLALRRTGTARSIISMLTMSALFLIATGCGASEGFDEQPNPTTAGGPRVADPRFEGSFEITEVVLDGAAVTVDQRPSIEIETEFGGLTVVPGCNTYFGSFTLDEGGAASFTVTGGTELDCGDLADQEDIVLAALAAADQWLATDDGFRFEGSDAAVSVSGPTG